MKSKLIPIDSIKFDETLYPRVSSNFHTVMTYASAMQAGAAFPPVTVATVDGELVLVDGWHRTRAAKKLKRSTIAAIDLGMLTRTEAFSESVRLNAINGQPLSFSEKMAAYKRLVDEGVPIKKVSEAIVFMPPATIRKYSAGRLTVATTGKPVFIRGPVKNVGFSEDKPISEEQAKAIATLTTDTQESLVDQLVIIIENKWLETKNETLMAKLTHLRSLLDAIKMPKVKVEA